MEEKSKDAVGNSGLVSQHRVSRFHNLQLRFSSRLPSSIDSAHLLKTASEHGQLSAVWLPWSKRFVLPVHMLYRFSTLLVSILCILPASTVKTGAASRVGMVRDSYVCVCVWVCISLCVVEDVVCVLVENPDYCEVMN
jgi:hypothetical protein